MFRPRRALNSANAMCVPAPLPVDAKLYLPGLALTRSTNSLSVFTSMTVGLMVSTFDTSMSGATGTKSSSTSNGSFLYSAALLPCVAAVPKAKV